MRAITKTAVVAPLTLIAAVGNAETGDQLMKLLPDDPAAGDHFGYSIATSGGIAIIGANRTDDDGTDSGAAYLFDVATGEQLFKLLPNDGASGSHFGDVVGISGNAAIVGAYWHSVAGTGPGAAYLFDVTTGQQTHKLVSDDGEADDWFGVAVAIDGNVAIVGASHDDDNGTGSGSAYLFDVATGKQLMKLLLEDGWAWDTFGQSVAISGTVAIIGAGNDGTTTDNGAAYLFDTTTGTQLVELVATDDIEHDRFGSSVATNGTIAAVGAYGDDQFGADSGSVYVFDVATGDQIFKLLPGDGEADDEFGKDVAVDGEHVIVGSIGDDDNGSSSGSAYVFDAATGLELVKLLPEDGAASDEFGRAVAAGGGIAMVGSRLDDDNGSASGSAYLFALDVDTDGDGLLDSWETNGIPYTDAGGVEQHFALPGADPMHKDLYVEVDAALGFSLSDGAVQKLEFAFGAAPLTNPDEVDGIHLHVLRDDSDLSIPAAWPTDGCWPLDFDVVRATGYGTAAERTSPDSIAQLEAKALAYRYCIVADHATPNNIGGCGETPGDSFVIFLGSGTYDDEAQAAVFMHELGHNLGLQHGGGDEVNGKANYPSIMNYVLSYKYAWNAGFWKLDFSRHDAGDLATLDESSLDELNGVGTVDGYYNDFWMPFGVNDLDDDGDPIRSVRHVRLNGSPADFGDTAGTWHQDGSYDVGVPQDLNWAIDQPAGISLPSGPSFAQTFEPHDDWAHVGLPLAATLGNAAPAIGFPTDELTGEAREWIDANFPATPAVCLADLTGNGAVSVEDLLQVLSSWGTPAGDVTGDGTTDVVDLLAVLAAWGSC